MQLFTDFRYVESARAVEGAELVETKRDLIAALADLLSGRVGFEAAHLSYAWYKTLSAAGLELVPRHGLVEALRAVKDARELDVIRRAAAITSTAFERLAGEQFVGRSERDLAWRMNELLHEAGADRPAFDALVGAGENSARPHAHPGDRVIGSGETVVVDAGAKLDGYCSDCTRTFATGGVSDELAHAYEVCLEAQRAAVEATCAGAGGKEVDAVARGIIARAGLGEKFGHGLGHGVGVEVHEAPRMADSSADTLAPGNVVTVEPGIYLEGTGGIRIEDLAVVTDGEAEVLTTAARELVGVA